MSDKERRNDLDATKELFFFLQGQIPDGYFLKKRCIPRLTPDQAWMVVWYIQNQYRQFHDGIARCGVCGSLYDSWSEGACLDYGKAPYYFCDSCMRSEDYDKKMRRNPDKELRRDYIEFFK